MGIWWCGKGLWQVYGGLYGGWKGGDGCGKDGWWLELMEKLRIEGVWVMVAAAKVGENVVDENNEK